jgi:hypothetical protein
MLLLHAFRLTPPRDDALRFAITCRHQAGQRTSTSELSTCSAHKESGAQGAAFSFKSIEFLYAALRRRRLSQPSPTSAEPMMVNEAGSGTLTCEYWFAANDIEA